MSLCPSELFLSRTHYLTILYAQAHNLQEFWGSEDGAKDGKGGGGGVRIAKDGKGIPLVTAPPPSPPRSPPTTFPPLLPSKKYDHLEMEF